MSYQYLEDIYALKLGQMGQMRYGKQSSVYFTRVPGGWIFSDDDSINSSTFVPFNDEFKGLEKNK